MNLPLEQKIAGVLVPVFALRTTDDLGIGDTHSLMEFVDWAAAHEFRLVKILPVNESGNDNSPYNAISSVALDPLTLRTSPEAIPDLHEEEFQTALREAGAANDPMTVDYQRVRPLKRRLLEAAYRHFEQWHIEGKTGRGDEFAKFAAENATWLADYTLFRMLIELNDGSEVWTAWPEEHRSTAAARRWLQKRSAAKKRTLESRRRYFAYVQWIAYNQWHNVKAHAEARGVALMGDIPFGVNFYSADVWAEPDLFRTDWCGGTPPDKIFKHDEFVQKWGQNWGIPLYDWQAMRDQDFAWWRRRVRGVREIFDLFRIDHVLGFYRIYGFPWRPERNPEFLPLTMDEALQRTDGQAPGFQPLPDDTPEHQESNRRDGEEYLRVVLEEAGEGRVIGEDLGEVPPYVRPNLTMLGIAGYKIPQWEQRGDGSLIPGPEYQRLSLTTYGTHDHDPLKTLWETMVRDEASDERVRWEWFGLCRYAGLEPDQSREFTPAVHEALVRALFESNAWIAVLMITDVFGRGERFNYPGTASNDNWTQRIHAPISELDLTPEAHRITELIKQTGRGVPESTNAD